MLALQKALLESTSCHWNPDNSMERKLPRSDHLQTSKPFKTYGWLWMTVLEQRSLPPPFYLGPKKIKCRKPDSCLLLSLSLFFLLIKWQVWWITSHVLPVWYQVFREKGHFPLFLSGNDWELEKAILIFCPNSQWRFGHMKRHLAAWVQEWDETLSSWSPPVVIYDVRSGPVITSPPTLSSPVHEERREIINAFVSPRTSLTHLTLFNKWCPIFSHSL